MSEMSGSIHLSAPTASVSFLLDGCLAQFELELRHHVSLLVFRRLSLADFLSRSAFLSYSTLQGLLCFTARHLSAIQCRLLHIRSQPLQLHTDLTLPPPFVAPLTCLTEPAKHILILRTILTLASHVNSSAVRSGDPQSLDDSSGAASVQLSLSRLLAEPSDCLQVSSAVCGHLERAALHFFTSPLPASPPLTRWTSFVHLLTGHDKKRRRHMQHAKGDVAGADDPAVSSSSEATLSDHERLVVLSEEMQQLWAALLGLLSLRCGRADSIVALFLPHIACALPSGGREAVERLMSADQHQQQADDGSSSQPQQHSLAVLDSSSLPALPPIPLPSGSHPPAVLVALIRSLSLLHLSIASRGELRVSHSLVSVLASLFSAKSTPNSGRRELASCLSSLLSPLTLSSWSSSVSYRQWFAVCQSLYAGTAEWIKRHPKAKNQTVAGPLLVAALSCCDPEAFIRHFTSTIQSLLLSYHSYRRKRLAAGSATSAECRVASSASIDSLQHLLHVYLMQRASRHETTIANLESIHSAFLLSRQHSSMLTVNDEDGYSWMKGSTQDGLVALILTTAKADRHFTAHEIILPMLESQNRRRTEQQQQQQDERGRGNSKTSAHQQPQMEGVSGQVVTGLRALAAILAVDDEVSAPHTPYRSEAVVGTNNKRPAPQLASTAQPTTLSAALAALRSSLLSTSQSLSADSNNSTAASALTFYNPHAVGEPASYLPRLAAIVGTILTQCDAVVGHVLLVDQTDDVTADEESPSAAVTEAGPLVDEEAGAEDDDEEDEADERRLATTTAMRLVLRVMSVIWPDSLPVTHTGAMLVKAALHVDRRTREASRRLLIEMCSADEHEAAKRVQRGTIVHCLLGRLTQLPNSFASSASRHRVLSELLLLLNQLLHAWLTHSTFDCRQLEGLVLHEVEAAVAIWLAAVHPLLRLACVAVLLTLRSLAHQLLGYTQHQHDTRQRGQHMSPIEARDASLQKLASIASPTRHFLVDSFTACSCSPTAPSLSLDSLLPNHQCAAEMDGAARSHTRPLLRSIAELGDEDGGQQQMKAAQVDEKDSTQGPLEQIRGALHQHRHQARGEVEEQHTPTSAPSAPPALSSLPPSGPPVSLLSLDDADSSDDGECYLPQSAHSTPRLQSLPSLISHTSEWRWSLLLAHWMRTAVAATTDTSAALPAAGPIVPTTHLTSVLSALFALCESRLLPFHSIHSSLCKRLKGRPPSSELSVLSAAGLPSSRLAVVKNLCLLAASTQSTSAAFASHSYIALQLLPLLSSPFSVVRRIGSVSIGNVHQSLTPALLQLLQPLEKTVATARDDVLRVHVSHVYRLLAESHTQSAEAAAGSSSASFVWRCQSWVVATFQWLAITGNEFRWDLLELRRHFCVVVERLASTAPHTDRQQQQPQQQQQTAQLDDSLRRQLFSLLLAWCGHGPSSLSYSSKVDKHASELLSRLRGTSAADKARQLKATYANEVRSFRLAALHAMAALLSTHCFDEQLTAAVQQQSQQQSAPSCPTALDGVGFVFPWLNSVLVSADSEVRDVAYRALEHVSSHNPRLITACMAYCYHPHSMLARRYFLVIAQLLLSQCQQADSDSPASSSTQLPFSLSLPCLLLLLLYKLGDPSYNVRSMSLRLLPVLETRYCPHLPSAPPSSLSAVVGSHLADTYRQVQLSLSNRLAASFSPLSDQLTIEACRRVVAMRSADSQQQLLHCLPPWLRNLRLTRPRLAAPATPTADEGYLLDEQWLIDSETWEGRTAEQRSAVKKADGDSLRAARPALFRHACYPTQSNQHTILAELLELTHTMHSSHATRTVELLWLSLGAVRDNVGCIVQLLMAGLERRQAESDFHADTLSTHKRVALFCSRANPLATVGKLVHTIYRGQDSTVAAAEQGTAERRGRLTVSHFALLLLVEVAYEIDFSTFDQSSPPHRQSQLSRGPSVAPSNLALSAMSGPSASCQATLDTLSVLLHIGVLGLHHSLQFIRHHSAILLINIVHNTAFNQQHHTARALFVPSRHSDVALDQQQQQPQQAASERGQSAALRGRDRSIAARTSAYSTLTAAFSSSRSRLSSAPSAGLSLAIAESQQLRVLGVRQRRALLLMNQLNSHGRPHSHSQQHSHTERASEVRLSEVVHTLLRVVADSSSRPSLSRRWWHHAVQWSVGSASPLSSSQSHLVYRALSPPLLLSHYWKCIAALDRHIAHWRECSGGSEGLVHLLLTLQQLVGCLEVTRSDGVSLSHRQSTSASSALRCELLPALLWSCVDVLHRAFSSPAVRSDSPLLVCCIRVIGACLSCARDDRHFEHAVYEWKRRRQSEQQHAVDQLLFVGVQPLMMTCLLPPHLSVYSSFPTLNMLSTNGVQLSQPDPQPQSVLVEPAPPPSPALVTAVFSFLGSFTPLPWSPLAPLLDISSFAQRVLASLVAQLPLILQHIDETREAHTELVPPVAASPSLPCTHQPPHLHVADSAELVRSCQSLSSLFSSLGLLELALVFACASAGHFSSSAAFVQSLSEPLLAVLPATVVLDACLLWLDVMDRMGAFVPIEPHFHQLSAPRQARQYAQLRHCSAVDCCAAAALCGGRPTLSHYILTMVAVVLAHCDWHACQLSAATAAPLFHRLQQLLHTSLAPLAAHTLTVAMERADSGATAQSQSHPTAHQLSHALLQPSTQPIHRYEPNPSRLSTLRDSQQPVLLVRVIDEARRESGVLRVTDVQQQQQQQRPSAPPQEECEQQWRVEEERKVQFVTDADSQCGRATQSVHPVRLQQAHHGADETDDDDSDSSVHDDSGDEAALSLTLPPHFHHLLSQPPPPAGSTVEAAAPPQHAALPPKPAPAASHSSSSSSALSSMLSSNVTTSVRSAQRGSALHVDVQLSIPCIPNLHTADHSHNTEHDTGTACASTTNTSLPSSPPRSQPASTVGLLSASHSSAPIVHAVKSRPRPLIRQQSPMSGSPQSTDGVLSELPLNTQQTSATDGANTAAAQSSPGGAAQHTHSNSASKPQRRSQLMSAMMEQRDRRRREDSRRKEDELARLHTMQQQLRTPVRPTQPASHDTADSSASRLLVQRTLDVSSHSLHTGTAALSSGGGRADSGAVHTAAGSGDVSATLREEKRRRDASGQKLRERRVGIRDRMKEAGVTGAVAVVATHSGATQTTPRRTSRGAGRSPHTDSGGRMSDAQRQSLVPCTFHLQQEEEAGVAAREGTLQHATLSLDDIMAGRVNYQ